MLRSLGDDKILKNIQKINYTNRIENPREILKELDNIGINYGSLFGDFDSIAKCIMDKKQLYSSTI